MFNDAVPRFVYKPVGEMPPLRQGHHLICSCSRERFCVHPKLICNSFDSCISISYISAVRVTRVFAKRNGDSSLYRSGGAEFAIVWNTRTRLRGKHIFFRVGAWRDGASGFVGGRGSSVVVEEIRVGGNTED
jgi:hypothetical protein